MFLIFRFFKMIYFKNNIFNRIKISLDIVSLKA